MSSDRVLSIARRIDRISEYLPRVVMVGAQVPAWFTVMVGNSRLHETFGFLPEQFAIRTDATLICTAMGLAVWGVYLEGRREKTLIERDEQLELAQKVLATLDRRLDDLIEELTEELGLTSGGNTKLSSGKCVRITIYAHDPTDRVFIPLGRRSTNPRFRDFGRKSYPDDQGLISRAWETGWGVETDLPAQKDQWVDEVSERHSIPTEVAKQFRLRARSLAALRLQVGREKAGVIVIESDDPKGIGGNVVDDYRSSRAYDELRALMPILVARNDFEHRKTNSYTSGSTVI